MDQLSLTNSENVKVLDAGFSTQVSHHLNNSVDGDVLWTARLLHNNPEAVIETHYDFIEAGSDVISTCTYQASIAGFIQHLGISEQESYDLIKKSVDLVHKAWERFHRLHPKTKRLKPFVAGSVGPYGAFLHDGSEYEGSYGKTIPVEVMREWHRPRIQALLEGGVDVLALETLPCSVEAEMLVELMKEFPEAKAWLCFSCKDGVSISNSENFQAVAKRCYDLNPNQIIAIGVNCVSPDFVKQLFTGINECRENNRIPLITYPNSGEQYEAEQGWLGKDKCNPLHSYVQTWVELGVKYVGGCCRTYAEDIKDIKNELTKLERSFHNDF